MNRVYAAVLGIFCGCTAGGAAGAEPGTLRVTGLRCEYMPNPLAVAEAAPRLGWLLEADRRGEAQSAYRVLVASSEAVLENNEGDLWDSGRVQSSRSVHVAYAGRPLESRRRCVWKVMAWDRDGVAGDWSVPAIWEMGLLAPADWTAQWVEAGTRVVPVRVRAASYETVDGSVRKDVTAAVAAMAARGEPIAATNGALGGDPARDKLKRLVIEYELEERPREGQAGVTRAGKLTVRENATATFPRSPVPYLRRAFEVARPVESARLYITALGLYEATLNGERVGDSHFAPGWTDYRKRVQYQVYDVTAQVKRGPNMLGAVVAPGWFSGRAGLFGASRFYGESPALLAQLEIRFADGGTQRIVSDGSWQRRDGPILTTDIMEGESYDAAAAIEGWCLPGAGATGWEPVGTRNEARTLEPTADHPVRILRELPALAVSEPKPGRWTFDLGQNMVGVVRIMVQESPGTVVTIRSGEMLNPDGTIYTENLRGAGATDVFTAKGGGPERWQPSFTFHGFRYVELTGLHGVPMPGTVTGVVIGSDLPATGTFSCSDGAINQLQSNIEWGQRGNYLSIPTDCPQRDERMGWMADAQVFAPTAAYNSNIAPFMSKWMNDVDDAQREDGAYADVAPAMSGLSFGSPAWADAGTFVPWTIYQMYGDERILERHIGAMTRWVEWCRRHSTGLIRDRDRGNDYGDWLSIGADTPKELIGTAYFARSAEIVADAYKVLGRDAEAARYRELFERVRAAFIAKYVSDDGEVLGRTQCGYVLALRFNLLPQELRQRVAERLIADIAAKNGHLSTGFVGVGLLLPTLTDAGRPDVAYGLLMKDTFPSWLFSVRHGATTIWERWNGWTPETGVHADASMNSFNHYSLGSCGQWLFGGVCGIEPDAAHPRFEEFVIRPQVDGPLNSAQATFDSVRGRISSEWNRKDGSVLLRVCVPIGARARVILSADESGGPDGGIEESGVSVRDAGGVTVMGREAGAVVLGVASGKYQFRWRHRGAAVPSTGR